MYYRINDQPQNDSNNTMQNIDPDPPKLPIFHSVLK